LTVRGFRGFRGGGYWTVVLGIVDIVVGILLIASPLEGAIALPLVLGVFGLIGGIILRIMSFQVRRAH